MLLTNLKLLEDDTVKELRKETCNACEHFTLLKVCEKCGCMMPVKWNFEYAACPLKKW